jgi:class 3 adenylate cyclase
VLVSERVAESGPPPGVTFVELGELPLKGISRPVRVLEARPAR